MGVSSENVVHLPKIVARQNPVIPDIYRIFREILGLSVQLVRNARENL